MKGTCNNFILHGAEHLAAPLSSLLSKARAFVPEGSERDGEKVKTLVAQDFMRPERLEVRYLRGCVCMCVPAWWMHVCMDGYRWI